ncbi:DUF3040 domain-containing protein [Arthrobacter sp. TmT3-37]
MGLSAEERRQWRELERQLAAEDPRTVQLSGSGWIRRTTDGSPAQVVIVLVAFVLLILAAIVNIPLIGIFGIILMIIGGTRAHLAGRSCQPAKGRAQTRGDIP